MTTTTESAAPNRDEELLGELMRQLSHVINIEVVLEEFCQRYPHLEAEARSYPRMQQALQGIQSMAAVHPKQLGDFRIIRQMARGGMGVIYEAIQERLKRRVVLKTMKVSWDVGPARLRFRREQEVLARLHQTHIVPIHTADETEGLHYFVMPYIEGASLNHVVEEARNCETSQSDGSTTSLPAIAAAWLKKSGRHQCREGEAPAEPSALRKQDDNQPSSGHSNTSTLRTSQEPQPPRPLPIHYFRSVAQAMADVAEGLHYAHQEGLLHRDLKPSNVMIEPNGKCWIIDFGLAGFLHQTEEMASSDSMAEETESLTHGHAIGTPAYMAPEQWEHQADVRTDVWGLGVTLYELLTLHRPFDKFSNTDSSEQKQQIRQIIVQEKPIPLSQYVPNIPADLAAICMKAMEKEPGKRYATAMAFAEDIQHWQRHEPTTALPGLHRTAWLWARRNTGWAVSVAAILAALLAGIVGLGYLNAHQAEQLRDREREVLVLEQQQIRLQQHEPRWSESAGKLITDALKIRKDDKLRRELVATLVGLDVNVIQQFPGGASSLAFDATGKKLLMGGLSDDWPVKTRLWDGAAENPDEIGSSHDGPVAFNAEGIPLQAVIKDNRTLDLWDLSQKRIIRSFSQDIPESKEPVLGLELQCVLSSDGTLVSLFSPISTRLGQLTLWDVASGKTLLSDRGYFTAFRFSAKRTGTTIFAAGTHHGSVVMWELPSGRKITEFSVSRTDITALTFGLDVRRFTDEFVLKHPVLEGVYLAVGTHGGEITVWRPAYEKLVNRYPGSMYDVFAFCFSPDGSTLVSGGRGDVRWWDVATAKLLIKSASALPYGALAQYMTAIEFTPDGRRIAIACKNPFDQGKARWVLVLETQDRRGITLLRGLDSAIARVLYSPQGKYISALSEGWQVAIWEAATGRLMHIFDVPVGLFTDNAGMAFSLDDQQFAFLSAGQANRWDLTTGKLLNQWKELPPALQEKIAFHPSGALLCGRSETKGMKYPPTSDFPRTLHPRVYRVRNLLAKDYAAPIYEITDFNYHIQDSCFAPDGTYLLLHGLSGTKEAHPHFYRALDSLSGKALWEKPAIVQKDNHSAGFSPNATGTLVLMESPDDDTHMLVEATSWKVVRKDKFSSVVFSADGLLRVTFAENDENSIVISRAELVKSMLKFPLDRHLRDPGINFDKTGQFIICGTYTSDVVHMDLHAIRSRLQDTGFTWPMEK